MHVHVSYCTHRILAGLICALVLLALGTSAAPSSQAHATGPRLVALAPSGPPLVRLGAPTSRARVKDVSLFPCQCGPFFGVAALSSDNVWMVGRTAGPLIEHWDGRHWRIVPGPTVGRDGGELLAIAALSAHDIWAVGAVDSSDGSLRTLTEHWDGTHWRVVPSPTPPDTGGYARLFGVAAVAPNDVWAVGESSIIEHWNGTRWRLVPSPAGVADLTSVAAVSAHDVWAVSDAPSIVHWDGTRWRVVPSPNGVPHFAPGADVTLNAIAAVSAHDIWAVGGYDAGACCRAGSGPLTEHWDGTRWRIVPSPNIPYSVEGDIAGITLSGVAVISTRDIWAVGTGIEHWDGHGWRIIANPIGAGGDFGPVSVAALSTRDVWAAGNRSDTQALMEHWDGRRWRIVPTPNTIR